MLGFNGYNFSSFTEDKMYIILILLISMLISFFNKNTNYLIEKFKPLNAR